MVGEREAVRMTRREAVLLLREGRAAAKAGKGVLDCPYNPNGNATERMRVAAWLRGYTIAKNT